jgi:tetratricopeptide (TPR) repeat protein
VPFLRRLLSGDYRRAVAAEAAGDYGEAARHYALCGEREKVAEMHLLRAERGGDAGQVIDELRDGLRWADPGTAARRRVARALGQRLLARARVEGAATVRDQAAVREAAALLEEGGEHREAGAALELLGDDEGASRAYERGGLLEEMEEALARERFRRRQADRVRDAFAAYQHGLAGGDRDAAIEALRDAERAAEDKGEYRRLREELEARRLAGGAVAFLLPGGRRLLCASAPEIRIGRDPEAHLLLRGAGVSRAHATLRVDGTAFLLRDAGSRTGTWLAGLRVDGEVPLAGSGRLRLGDDCELDFASRSDGLRLEVIRGMDRGAVLVALAPGASLDLSSEGLPARLHFDAGRPFLDAAGLRVDGVPTSPLQLLRRDRLSIADLEVEVSS